MNKIKGFTLIELLVVIAIIGILASIVMISLNSGRSVSRDARRVSDMQNLYTALVLFYDQNGEFPSCEEPTYAGGCDIVAPDLPDGKGDSTLDGQFLEILKPEFISKTPEDPANGSEYFYAYFTGTEWPTGSGKYYNFFIGTILENLNHPALNSSISNGMPGLEGIYLLGEPR